ncbi:MAG TPA: Uma2 family endonuclease [Thermoanaerobaculia bacterium]|nr:Uma2 family endonuclease [Thermoanaerobaculia bacterium]
MVAPVKKRLLTINEYRRMGEVGIFHEDDRVELIRGEIYELTPITNPHAACLRRLNSVFKNVEDAILSPQNPVALEAQGSEPLTDLALLRFQEDFYRSAHPGPGAVLLAIEVSDSSLVYDRNIKVPLYTESGILETWIVDLNGDVVLVFREPSPGGYKEERAFRRGETISPLAFPGLSVAVDAILGTC